MEGNAECPRSRTTDPRGDMYEPGPAPLAPRAAFLRDRAANAAACRTCRWLGSAACLVGCAVALAVGAAARVDGAAPTGPPDP